MNGEGGYCAAEDAEIYTGSFRNSKPHGEGAALWSSQDSHFEGVWENGKISFALGVFWGSAESVIYDNGNGNGVQFAPLDEWCQARGRGVDECLSAVNRKAALDKRNSWTTPTQKDFEFCRERRSVLNNYKADLTHWIGSINSKK